MSSDDGYGAGMDDSQGQQGQFAQFGDVRLMSLHERARISNYLPIRWQDIPKRPYIAPLFRVDDEVYRAMITTRVLATSSGIQRDLTPHEAQAMAEMSARNIRYSVYQIPLCLGTALVFEHRTRSRFKFPFVPVPNTFDPNVFPSARFAIVKGNMARFAWHIPRFFAYAFAARIFWLSVLGFKTQADDQRLLSNDPQLSQLGKDIAAANKRNADGRRQEAIRRAEAFQRGRTLPDSGSAPAQAPAPGAGPVMQNAEGVQTPVQPRPMPMRKPEPRRGVFQRDDDEEEVQVPKAVRELQELEQRDATRLGMTIAEYKQQSAQEKEEALQRGMSANEYYEQKFSALREQAAQESRQSQPAYPHAYPQSQYQQPSQPQQSQQPRQPQQPSWQPRPQQQPTQSYDDYNRNDLGDDFYDDASPVSAAEQRKDNSGWNQQPASGTGQGSAWDRLRTQGHKGDKPVAISRAPPGQYGWDAIRKGQSPPNQQQSQSQSGKDSSDKYGDNEAARNQAQKDFDAMLERERSGENDKPSRGW